MSAHDLDKRNVAGVTRDVTTLPIKVGEREPEFEFQSVTKEFPGEGRSAPFTAVQDISLKIQPASFVCIIGPSGCGKSTLLNMAAGLMRPSHGTVLRRGEPLSGLNPVTAYMTQKDSLLPWRTLERNVGLPLEISGVRRVERKERIANALEMVGLENFGSRYPSELSGGMLKRASLARTLIQDPESILMDEPFGALDAQMRLTLQRDLKAIWERDRKTVLFVTHDLEEAIALGDHIVVFGSRPGRIIHQESVPFTGHRDPVEMRADPDFSALWKRLWSLLEPSTFLSEPATSTRSA